MAPVRRDDEDEDEDALFVKNGAPVKFCFHKSVTQGRGQITRDVERHGGQIVANERAANVLLVDEQEDLAFMRRRYYSSTELYRLSLYVEPRGFVQTCIRSGTYRHVGPVEQGMPGRAPDRRRERVPFTEEDRDHLAYYLATRCPARGGRMGNNPYKDLERLGQTEDPSWAWARRHTFHSWREHYKMHPGLMDARIDHYLERLKGIGHHFGHDPRSHDYRNLRRELAEEDEEDEEDEGEGEEGEGEGESEEQYQRIERREEQVPPAVAPPRRQGGAARDYLACHEQDLVAFNDGEGDGDIQQEVAIQELQRVKRHRAHPGAQRRPDSQKTQAKKARVLEASSNERRASGVEVSRGESSPRREEDVDLPESQEIEGSDLFGDRAYEDSRLDFVDEGAMPFSPRPSPVPEQGGPPPSTQATLVASPRFTEKEPRPAPVPSPTRDVEALVQTPPRPPTVPPSSQQTLVVTEERARGASAQPGPSVPRGRRTQGGALVVDVPHRSTRARSRSIEPQSQPPQRLEDQGAKGKGKVTEEVLIEEDIGVEEEGSEEDGEVGSISVTLSMQEALEDDMAVEGLLEASIGKIDEGDGGSEVEVSERDEDIDGSSDGGSMPELPRFQEVEVGNEPSDSDDAETHGSLVQGAVREGSTGGGDMGGESGSEQEQDDADRVERMASETLRTSPAPTPPQPRVAGSKAATQTQMQTQFSPRRTRSGNRGRAAPPVTVFPSPGTKARAVVDRVQEEERRTPYAPPRGSRASRAVRGRGKRRGGV